MATAVKAVYENGIFKPQEPVQLAEHTEVKILLPETPEGEILLPDATTQEKDPTGWKALDRFIGMWKGGGSEEANVAEDHDRYIYE